MTMAPLHARILIIDDEPANLEFLDGLLRSEGYRNIAVTTDPRTGLALLAAEPADLILLDLHMPHVDGFAVMREIGQRSAADDFLPILVLTADVTAAARERALSSGAKDFLTKPLDATEVLLRIRNLLETRLLHRAQVAARAAAETAARRAALLADVSRVLGASLDYETTLGALPAVLVPAFADGAAVHVRDEDGLRISAVNHRDPDHVELLRELAGSGGPPPAAQALEAALGHGGTGLVTRFETGLDEAAAAALVDRPGELARILAVRSLLVIPLRAGTELVGALSLYLCGPGRAYGPADAGFAEEIAARAGLALHNASLFRTAQQATRARDEILGIVAHDLRNALNTLVLGAELGLEMLSAGEPVGRPQLEMLLRNGRRMTRLIEDLLEIRRLAGGSLRLEPMAGSLHVTLEECVETLRPLALARGLELVHTPRPLPTLAYDAGRIHQVVSNLVGNAIKFTPPGGRIEIAAEASDDGGEVRVAVRDTGEGMAPEQIPHVFGAFWQARKGDRRGLGLGLAIVKSIVEGHHGRVWVESRQGSGSCFTFALPVTTSQDPSPDAAATGAAGEALRDLAEVS